MGKIIRLTESQLKNVIKRVINEEKELPECGNSLRAILQGMKGTEDFVIKSHSDDIKMVIIQGIAAYEPCVAPKASIFK